MNSKLPLHISTICKMCARTMCEKNDFQVRNGAHLNRKRSFTIMLAVFAAVCILLTNWRNSALKVTEMQIIPQLYRPAHNFACNPASINFLILTVFVARCPYLPWHQFQSNWSHQINGRKTVSWVWLLL